MSIRNRLIRGIAANGFGQLITVVIQIVGVPIYIKSWGLELYGEWLILSTIATCLAKSDVGFSSVAANEMTMLVSKDLRLKALTIFNSTWLLISGISLLILSVLLATLWFFPLEDWFHISHQTHLEVIIVVILLTLHVLVGLQGKLISAGFRCEGDYALGTLLNNLVRLLESGSMLILVYLGANPLKAASVFLFMRITGTALMRIVLFKRSPWLVYGFNTATIKTIKRLARPAFSFMAFPVGSLFKDQGLVTVIGLILGPAAVAVFSTVRTLVNSAYQLISMINQAIWPEISIAYGKNDADLAKVLHRYAFQASTWLAMLSIVGLFLFGEWIIKIWTVGEIIPEPKFFFLMLLVFLVNSLWSSSSIVLFAINQHERMTIFYLIVASGSLIFAVWLIKVLGLSGAAVTLLILNSCMLFFVIRLTLRILHDDFSSFSRFVLKIPSLKFLHNTYSSKQKR